MSRHTGWAVGLLAVFATVAAVLLGDGLLFRGYDMRTRAKPVRAAAEATTTIGDSEALKPFVWAKHVFDFPGGGVVSSIVVLSEGKSDIDCYVYEAIVQDNGVVRPGAFVTSDDRMVDECRMVVMPKVAGKFVLFVQNNGKVAERYTIVVN